MNLDQALSLAEIQRLPARERSEPERRLTARQVAQKVFSLSAAAGSPFEGITKDEWARKWLASDEFVLMEIPLNRVAVIGKPKYDRILAQAQNQEQHPIVVDKNKRGLGITPAGFTPSVIVVDGQTRHKAAQLQGREKVWAWVGMKVRKLVELKPAVLKRVNAAAASPGLGYVGTKMDAAMILHAAVASPVGPRRQDTGDGGPQPTMRSAAPDGPDFIKNRGAMKNCKECSGPKMKATGAGAGGATGGPGGATSGANPMRKGMYSQQEDPSDTKQTVDPSDRKQIPDPSDRLQSPTDESPGSGVGPRLRPNKGASHSEMQDRMKGEGKKIDKIYEKGVRALGMDPHLGPGGGGMRMPPRPIGPPVRIPPSGGRGGSGATTMPVRVPPTSTPPRGGSRMSLLSKKGKRKMKAVAPPGWGEKKMKSLKRKVGKTSAFKIAWWRHSEGKDEE